jgi:molecular chaperone DnaK (HSP70)
MLANFFGRPPEALPDMDLSVALGAAYQAASHRTISQVPGLQIYPDTGLVLDDCVTYHVGIAVLDHLGNITKLIRLYPGDRLSTWSQPYPVITRSGTESFPPIALYTGDSKALRSEDYLGSVTLTLPPGIAPGTRAEVMLRLDQNGLVQVQLLLKGESLPADVNRMSAQI